VAAVYAEAGAEADAGLFGGYGYGSYGYPGYGHHGYARPLLATGYSTHSYHPSPAYHAGIPAAAYAAAPLAHHVSYPAVPAQPIAHAAYAAAPAPIAAPAPYVATAVAAPVAAIAPAIPAGPTASQYHSQVHI